MRARNQSRHRPPAGRSAKLATLFLNQEAEEEDATSLAEVLDTLDETYSYHFPSSDAASRPGVASTIIGARRLDQLEAKVSVDFDGGQLSSDAGVLLLRGVEKELGLAYRLACPDSCTATKQPLRSSGKADYYTSELPHRDVPKVPSRSGSAYAVGGQTSGKLEISLLTGATGVAHRT
jgi:hypothetical protein